MATIVITPTSEHPGTSSLSSPHCCPSSSPSPSTSPCPSPCASSPSLCPPFSSATPSPSATSVHPQHADPRSRCSFSRRPQPAKLQWRDLQVCSLLQHYGTVHAIASSPKYLFTASDDHDIVVWQLSPLSSFRRLSKHQSAVTCLAIDDSRLYSGSADTRVLIWDLDSLLMVRSLTRHTSGVLGIDASSPRYFASLASDYSAVVWSKDTFQCVALVSFDTLQVCMALSVDLSTRYMFELYTGGTCTGVFRWHFPLACAPQGLQPRAAHPALHCAGLALDYSNEWLLASLKEFVAFQSVSQDPTCSSQSWACAKYLRRILEDTGFESKLCSADLPINPVVLARYTPPHLAANAPCLLFVGHYDVVPVGPFEGWINGHPFALHSEGGHLYARGVTDNKGPVMAFIAAVRELIATQQLQCSVLVCVEGEEETGSRGFRDVVRDNMDWLGHTTHILVSNNYWITDDHPCLTYGMRGVIKMRLSIEGLAENLHSGVHGGSVHEPMVDLVRVLGGLVASDGQILIPNFTQKVLPVSADEHELLQATYTALESSPPMLPISSTAAKQARSLNIRRESDIRSLLHRRWQWPSISIHSVTSSVQGEELSVIPKRVSALVTVRTVPDQSPERLVKMFVKHVKSCFKMNLSPNILDIAHLSSGDWWLGNPSSPFFASAHNAIEKVWGVPPLYVREGGTLATTRYLEETLKASALHLPLGQASDSAHMLNERLRLLNLFNGREVMKEIILSFGSEEFISN